MLEFLANVPDYANSLSALHAKASIVYEQAAELVSEYRASEFCDGTTFLLVN